MRLTDINLRKTTKEELKAGLVRLEQMDENVYFTFEDEYTKNPYIVTCEECDAMFGYVPMCMYGYVVKNGVEFDTLKMDDLVEKLWTIIEEDYQ